MLARYLVVALFMFVFACSSKKNESAPAQKTPEPAKIVKTVEDGKPAEPVEELAANEPSELDRVNQSVATAFSPSKAPATTFKLDKEARKLWNEAKKAQRQKAWNEALEPITKALAIENQHGAMLVDAAWIVHNANKDGEDAERASKIAIRLLQRAGEHFSLLEAALDERGDDIPQQLRVPSRKRFQYAGSIYASLGDKENAAFNYFRCAEVHSSGVDSSCAVRGFQNIPETSSCRAGGIDEAALSNSHQS